MSEEKKELPREVKVNLVNNFIEQAEELHKELMGFAAEIGESHHIEHAARKVLDAIQKLQAHPLVKVQHAHAEGQVITVSTRQEIASVEDAGDKKPKKDKQEISASDIGRLEDHIPFGSELPQSVPAELFDLQGKNVCEGLQIDFTNKDIAGGGDGTKKAKAR